MGVMAIGRLKVRNRPCRLVLRNPSDTVRTLLSRGFWDFRAHGIRIEPA
jgi:hypothetical protein